MSPRKRTEPTNMPELLRVVDATVRATAKGLPRVVKWNNQWVAGNDLILCYGSFSQHVGIEFWRGSTVLDPTGLLEGTGKNLRHVKIRTTAEARSPALKRLIQAAIELDKRTPRRTR